MKERMKWRKNDKPSESALRGWLARVYGERVRWVEPTYGSTTGMPDAEVDLEAGWKLPIELKSFTRRGILKIQVRPSQRRYHILAHKNGHRTAFLGVSSVESQRKAGHHAPTVYLFNGAYISHNSDYHLTGHVMAPPVAVFEREADASEVYYSRCRSRMEEILKDPLFWELKNVEFKNGKMISHFPEDQKGFPFPIFRDEVHRLVVEP